MNNRILERMAFQMHIFSIDWMIADIFSISFERGWRIESYPKSRLFSEKFLIRIDSIDQEYKASLYGLDYKPLVLIEENDFDLMIEKVHKLIEKILFND